MEAKEREVEAKLINISPYHSEELAARRASAAT
jgi:hypothetical protein